MLKFGTEIRVINHRLKRFFNSCPSRYTQTASEKMTYLKELAAKDKEARDKVAAAAKEKEEKDRVEKENKEFQSRLLEIFK